MYDFTGGNYDPKMDPEIDRDCGKYAFDPSSNPEINYQLSGRGYDQTTSHYVYKYKELTSVKVNDIMFKIREYIGKGNKILNSHDPNFVFHITDNPRDIEMYNTLIDVALPSYEKERAKLKEYIDEMMGLHKKFEEFHYKVIMDYGEKY
jgi:hypothetical protein